MVSHNGRRVNGVLHSVVVAALQLPDRHHHVHLPHPRRASAAASWRSVETSEAPRVEPIATPTGMPEPDNRATAVAAHIGSPSRTQIGTRSPGRKDSRFQRAWLRVQQRVVNHRRQRRPAAQCFRGEPIGIETSVVKFEICPVDRNGHCHFCCSSHFAPACGARFGCTRPVAFRRQ